MQLNFDNWPILKYRRDDGDGGFRDVVNTTEAQTLTNKTLTSPTITTPTISSPVITGGLKGPYPIVTPTGAGAIAAADSGSIIMLNASAGFQLTLPAPAAGLNYTFIVGAAFATTSFTIVTNGGSNIFFGGADVNGAKVACAAQDSINFINTAETIGDTITVISDGTNWYVTGFAAGAGGVTFTVT